MLIGNFFIDEGVHIKVYSLEMEDEVLRSFANSCFLRNISFFIAEIAFVVGDQLAQDKSIERFS
jgi:hypothetical protein